MPLIFILIIFYSPQVLSDLKVTQIKEPKSWLKNCERSNPNNDGCFKEMFSLLIPKLSRGIPEINIQPFEPLMIPQINVERNEEVIALLGSFNNIQIRGASNASVSKAHLNLKKKILNFNLDFPRLKLSANYNLKGNIFLLPLVGNGNITILLKNIKATIESKISLRKIPEEAIYIDSLKVKFTVDTLRIHLGNLFNNNKVLSASFHMFLNQNSKEILKELQQGIENGLSDILVNIWNSVFNKLPLKFWLLSN